MIDDEGVGLEDLITLSDLRRLPPGSAPASESDGLAADSGPIADLTRPQASALLVSLLLKTHRLGVTTDGRPFAAAHDLPHVAHDIMESSVLRQKLAADYYEHFEKVPSSSALTEALTVCAGKARKCHREPIWTRVAEHEGTVWIDLADRHDRVIRLSVSGWSVQSQAPVLFRRSGLTAPLPEPARGADLSRLWRLLNVSEADQPLLVAWLIAAMRPDIPHPVLGLFGEQGTGKTTAMRMLASLLDPSTAPARRTPRDENSWVVAASSSWVVPLDNLSKLTPWLSDALCRAVTGDADITRTFYTNADVTVFAFRRAIIINGIDLGKLRGDLAERLLRVHLRPIDDLRRRQDADLSHDVESLRAEILGGLLDLAVRVMRHLPETRLERSPRMADFAHILATVDRLLETRGLETYLGQSQELAADALTSEAVLIAINHVVAEPFTGTSAQLLDMLQAEWPYERVPNGAWPKDARELTVRLRRHAPDLRKLGWTVEDLGQGGKAKAVRFRLVPPVDAAPPGLGG